MEEKKCCCPHCGGDLTAFIQSKIEIIIAEEENKKLLLAKEKKEKRTKETLAKLKKWREENPDKVLEITKKAAHSRTKESFRKQAASLKQTQEMKMIKFAELVMQARENGIEITPETNRELMKKAFDLVKSEKKKK